MLIGKKSIFAWMGLALAFLAILVVFKTASRAESEIPSAAGVTAVPIQIGRESFGIAMIDPKSETIWIYELSDRAPAHSRLKLFAARNWHYDKMLEEFNSAQPKPQQVKSMIEQMLKPGAAEPNNVDLTPLAEPNSKTEK